MKRRTADNLSHPLFYLRTHRPRRAHSPWIGALLLGAFLPQSCVYNAAPIPTPLAAPTADLAAHSLSPERDWFPNLVSGLSSVFIDAALIPSPATAAIFGSAQGPDFGDASLPLAARAFEPGRFYLVELRLIRDHNIDGVYPSVSLFGGSVRLSDFWAEGKPQKFSLFFQVPRRALTAADRNLTIRIPRGAYRLAIDEISVREFGIVPLWPGRGDKLSIASPHSNSTVVSPGAPSSSTINFYWQMPETDRLLGVCLVMRPISAGKSDETGKNRSVSPDPLSFSTTNIDETRCISVPHNRLPPGLSRWCLEVYQYKPLLTASDWREIDCGAAAETTPEASYNSQTVAPFSDRSFFPIGIYGAAISDYAELSAAGFNMVQASAHDIPSLKAILEAAQAHNLKLLLSPASLLREIEKNGAVLTATLRAALLNAVAAWYLDDAPEGRSVSPKVLDRTRRELLRLGLGRPGAAALLRSWRARDYAPTVDIFMSDPYPIPFEPLSWISDCLDEIRRTIADDSTKRAWSVIQAFPWKSVSDDPALLKGRAPTAAELRALTALALSHGAQGIFFYALESGRYRLRDDKPLWEAVKSVVAELRKIKS